MSCVCVIKPTFNCSFWTIQYTCFVISSIMSKLCLLFRPNVVWTDGTNLSLIDEVAMIKWVTWESYISQMSLVTYVFHCTFQVTIMWRTIEKSLKKIERQLLLLKNHLDLQKRFRRTWRRWIASRKVWLKPWRYLICSRCTHKQHEYCFVANFRKEAQAYLICFW